MFPDSDRQRLAGLLNELEERGLAKHERVIASAQQPVIVVPGRGQVVNFCANNYLGLANHPALLDAVRNSLDQWGYGLSSVRFICGTQQIHRQLEERIAAFLETEDTILYGSCFDANGGLFETVLGPEDAIISDALNHASIIDGIRLCKAKRFVYSNRDMGELEARLKEADAQGARTKMIATDGVFSMDGHVAPLKAICELADRFGALVMVDDSHATGFFGPGGRGTPAYHEVMPRVDIITSTLGKALGGASGGFTTGRKEIIQLLRQRSRPYLFSNSLAPSIVAATLQALEIVQSQDGRSLRRQLVNNTVLFRGLIVESGLEVVPGEHPIVPVMIGDARKARRMAERLLDLGIYVIAFSFPVVAEGKARIRVQVSAAHTELQLRQAADAFAKVAREE